MEILFIWVTNLDHIRLALPYNASKIQPDYSSIQKNFVPLICGEKKKCPRINRITLSMMSAKAIEENLKDNYLKGKIILSYASSGYCDLDW